MIKNNNKIGENMINSWKNKKLKTFKGKTIVLTGATSGLGLETLKHLCSLGANVIVGVRNTKRAESQAKKILETFKDASITIFKLDLTSLDSILEFAENVKTVCKNGFDALINNAGIYAQEEEILEYGYEKHFFTNTLAPIILSKSLLPVLEKQPDSKIIFVSSISFNFTKINFSDIDFTHQKSKMNLYANTKRWLTFYALEMAKVLEEKGSNTSVVICHPGVSGTTLMSPKKNKFLRACFKPVQALMNLLLLPPKKASLTEVTAVIAKTDDFEWISPSVFNIWGYPKKTRIKIKHFKPYEIIECYEKIEEIISKMTNVKN